MYIIKVFVMKRVFTLLFLVLNLSITKAQTYVTIPDTNFVSWLQLNVPSAMSGNQMDITDVAVTTRTNVNVNFQGITDFTGIQYFTSLKDLSCISNSLTSFPPLPNSILEFNCSMNPLIQLPVLPSSLSYLTCYDCQLTSLPSLLPNSLEYIVCSDNTLIQLPVLPNSLVFLDCSNSQLTSLSSLPPSLLYFNCANNQLTQLPVLPMGLSNLTCSYNQLTYLPVLPFNLKILYCSHNNISCFPLFPNSILKYNPTSSIIEPALDINLNSFTCLPNYISAMDSTTLSYPLCAPNDLVNNPNGCVDYKKVSGFVFHDVNNDCYKTNIAEFGLRNVAARFYDNSNVYLGSAFGGAITNYSFSVPMGNYKVAIDTLNKPYMSQCINPGIDSLITLNAMDLSKDSVNFPVNCKPGFDVGVQSIVTNGIIFPGQIHKLIVNAGDMGRWYRLYCSNGVSGNVSFSVSGPVTFIGPASGALTPTVTGNIYSYNIADFGAVNNNVDFNLLFKTDTTAQVGDIICISATVTPINGDNVQSNNIMQFCYFVTNSLDPNFKEVYPVAVEPNYNDWLTYTIHFQNTESVPAINISLKDILDNKLDASTLEIINYSDYNTVELAGNNFAVSFTGINLPENAVGFIQYRIKPKNNWLTDTIKNTASVFFDYNAEIKTNTAKTYIITETGVREMDALDTQVTLAPNPTDGSIEISSKYEITTIEVLSITNQSVLTENVKNQKCFLNLQNYLEGIYFVRINLSSGACITKKVIKL